MAARGPPVGQRLRLGAAALLSLLAGPAADGPTSERDAPLAPGTAAKCWGNGFGYERCCLGEDEACWDSAGGFTRAMCCSGFYEAAVRAQDNPGSVRFAPFRNAVISNAETNPQLMACVQSFRDGSAYEKAYSTLSGLPRVGASDLCGNDFIRAAECVAQLPEVSVALDLFLGAGCSAAAIAYGLGHGKVREGKDRPRELFSFENRRHVVDETVGPSGLLGKGARAGWWKVARANSSSPVDTLAFQARLAGHRRSAAPPSGSQLASAPSGAVTVWATAGWPYPHTANNSESYSWNTLDVICQHRAPLDMALIDTSSIACDKEWTIIEIVCRPRWVLIFNLNLHSGSSWIFHRLELLGYWKLELRGHFPLHNEPWLGLQEVRRVRSWAIFSRRPDAW